MNLTPRERAMWLLAGRLEIVRRRNPSMGGPSQQDQRLADELIALLESQGLTIVPTAHVIVEHGRAFDAPLNEDDAIPIPWNERTMGHPCPATGTINGHPFHRVKRTITYSRWEPAPDE